MEKELLHILSERTGCMYLSDLKFIRDTQKIKSELEKLSPQDFSIKQWNDAINYLTEKKVDFSSGIEAKNFLLGAEIITKQPNNIVTLSTCSYEYSTVRYGLSGNVKGIN